MAPDPLLPDHTFLGQQSFQVSVLPRRRALLVTHGNQDQLRRAIHGALSVWGGGRFPILPVRASGEVDTAWLELADVLAVDEVVDFTNEETDPPWVDMVASECAKVAARPLEDARFWNPHPVTVVRDSMPGHEIRLPADNSLTSLLGAGSGSPPSERECCPGSSC